MSDTCETVKIVAPPEHKGEDYIIINKEDFDEKIHKLFVEKKENKKSEESK